jgi:hypothetical protein
VSTITQDNLDGRALITGWTTGVRRWPASVARRRRQRQAGAERERTSTVDPHPGALATPSLVGEKFHGGGR